MRQVKLIHRRTFAIIIAVLVFLSVPLLSISVGLFDTAYIYAEDEQPGDGNGDPDPGNPDPGDPDPGNPDPGDPDPGNPDPGDPDPGNPDPPPVTYTVEGVSIYYKDDGREPLAMNSVYGNYPDYSLPDSKPVQIKTKGQTVTFDTLSHWTDGKKTYESRNESFVSWSTSDPSVATVSPGGMVSPLKDGTVDISARVPGSYTQTGADFVATVRIQIFGQSDGRYITAIRIVDETGRQITVHNFYLLEEDLSVAMVQFHAEVDVFDPKTNKTVTISTKGEDGEYVKISAQAPDLSDVYWNVGDRAMSAIERDWGLFRPVRYGSSFFYVATRATLDNSELSTTAAVSSLNPKGIGEESYNPQPSIRVKAYYELSKPKNLSASKEEDPFFVIDETYSLADITQMGLFTETYTALGNGSYMTMTGTGVGLGTLLTEAGVNLNGVNGMMFYAADSHMSGQFITYSYLFAPRYYYPNIYTGFAPYAEAKQVQPMLATVSNQIANGKTEPNYVMSEATRFRLLLGGRPGDTTTNYTIKWVNTIIVELTGGPGTDFGDGSGTGDGTGTGDGDGDGDETSDGDGNSDGIGSGSGGDSGDGEGEGEAGGNSGIGDDDGTGGAGGNSGEGDDSTSTGSDSGGREGSNETETSDLAIGTGAENEVETTIGIDAEDVPLTAGAKESAPSKPSGRYNIYQVMNINDSKVPLAPPGNPFKPYAPPAAISILGIGGFSSFFWFRRESGMVAYHAVSHVVSKLV